MSVDAVGYDLASPYETIIDAYSVNVVYTNLSFEFPPNCYGRIASRSGMSLKTFSHVGGGVIDPDYRGNVQVILFNFSCIPICINAGDRIAQLILERYENASILECNILSETERGNSGIGSSDICQICSQPIAGT